MSLPKKLNGYPVVAIAYRGAGSYYVMVHREDAKIAPWVSAVWCGQRDWYWGHYFPTQDALLTASDGITWLDRKTLQPLAEAVTNA